MKFNGLTLKSILLIILIVFFVEILFVDIYIIVKNPTVNNINNTIYILAQLILELIVVLKPNKE